MDKIRIGAIGVGGIGGHQFRIAVNDCSDIMQPVAVCDNNAEIAKRVAKNSRLMRIRITKNFASVVIWML